MSSSPCPAHLARPGDLLDVALHDDVSRHLAIGGDDLHLELRGAESAVGAKVSTGRPKSVKCVGLSDYQGLR